MSNIYKNIIETINNFSIKTNINSDNLKLLFIKKFNNIEFIKKILNIEIISIFKNIDIKISYGDEFIVFMYNEKNEVIDIIKINSQTQFENIESNINNTNINFVEIFYPSPEFKDLEIIIGNQDKNNELLYDGSVFIDNEDKENFLLLFLNKFINNDKSKTDNFYKKDLKINNNIISEIKNTIEKNNLNVNILELIIVYFKFIKLININKTFDNYLIELHEENKEKYNEQITIENLIKNKNEIKNSIYQEIDKLFNQLSDEFRSKKVIFYEITSNIINSSLKSADSNVINYLNTTTHKYKEEFEENIRYTINKTLENIDNIIFSDFIELLEKYDSFFKSEINKIISDNDIKNNIPNLINLFRFKSDDKINIDKILNLIFININFNLPLDKVKIDIYDNYVIQLKSLFPKLVDYYKINDFPDFFIENAKSNLISIIEITLENINRSISEKLINKKSEIANLELKISEIKSLISKLENFILEKNLKDIISLNMDINNKNVLNKNFFIVSKNNFGDFDNISEAILSVKKDENKIIFIRDYNYKENIRIFGNKLFIKGIGTKKPIISSNKNTCISLKDSDLKIENIEFIQEDDNILIETLNSNLEIINCNSSSKIKEVENKLFNFNNSQITISNSIIFNSGNIGIFFEKCSNCTINNSEIYNNNIAIYLKDSKFFILKNTKLYNNFISIKIDNSSINIDNSNISNSEKYGMEIFKNSIVNINSSTLENKEIILEKGSTFNHYNSNIKDSIINKYKDISLFDLINSNNISKEINYINPFKIVSYFLIVISILTLSFFSYMYIMEIKEKDIKYYVENKYEDKLIKFLNENYDNNKKETLIIILIDLSAQKKLDNVIYYLTNKFYSNPNDKKSLFIIETFNNHNVKLGNYQDLVSLYLKTDDNSQNNIIKNLSLYEKEEIFDYFFEITKNEITNKNYIYSINITKKYLAFDKSKNDYTKKFNTLLSRLNKALNVMENNNNKIKEISNKLNSYSTYRLRDEISELESENSILRKEISQAKDFIMSSGIFNLNAFIIDYLDGNYDKYGFNYIYEIALPEYDYYLGKVPSIRERHILVTNKNFVTKGWFNMFVKKTGSISRFSVYKEATELELLEIQAKNNIIDKNTNKISSNNREINQKRNEISDIENKTSYLRSEKENLENMNNYIANSILNFNENISNVINPKTTYVNSNSNSNNIDSYDKDMIINVINEWQRIKARNKKQLIEDDYDKILSGKALQENYGSVKWLADNNAYWDIYLRDIQFLSFNKIASNKVEAIAKLSERGDYYENNERVDKTSYDNTYKVSYKLEKIYSNWYIYEMNVKK